MGAQRQITVFRSEYQIDTAIRAAGVVSVCTHHGKHLCGERDPLFASRFEDRETVQGFPDGPAQFGIGLGEG